MHWSTAWCGMISAQHLQDPICAVFPLNYRGAPPSEHRLGMAYTEKAFRSDITLACLSLVDRALFRGWMQSGMTGRI